MCTFLFVLSNRRHTLDIAVEYTVHRKRNLKYAQTHENLVLIALSSTKGSDESVKKHTRESLYCSHTQSIDIVEGSDQISEL